MSVRRLTALILAKLDVLEIEKSEPATDDGAFERRCGASLGVRSVTLESATEPAMESVSDRRRLESGTPPDDVSTAEFIN